MLITPLWILRSPSDFAEIYDALDLIGFPGSRGRFYYFGHMTSIMITRSSKTPVITMPQSGCLFFMSVRWILIFVPRSRSLYGTPQIGCLLRSEEDPFFPRSMRRMLISYVSNGPLYPFLFHEAIYLSRSQVNPYCHAPGGGCLFLIIPKAYAYPLCSVETDLYSIHEMDHCLLYPKRWTLISYVRVMDPQL